ncbi:putative calcium-binding protein cml27 [Quercus suber]|uniref:Calcium-binding protein cml27 n=1 Tax=Quercus suber TaxID=58331 RepID=A0AAW0L3W3_QUESU
MMTTIALVRHLLPLQLRDAFKLYDQDQNGLISASELHLVVNCLGMKCFIEDCHRMIQSINFDGD